MISMIGRKEMSKKNRMNENREDRNTKNENI